MSAAKHTPGPWVADAGDMEADADHIFTISIYGADRHLATVSAFSLLSDHHDGVEYVTTDGPGAELLAQAKANARLIAAAPELLASLKLILTRWDGCDADDTPPAVEAARKVVAKAEGSKA